MRIILFILLSFSAIASNAHDYYFGYAEVTYNSFEERFESTIVVTTHDLEMALKNERIDITLVDLDTNTTNLNILEAYLNNHFVFNNTDIDCTHNLIGYEVSLNGTASFHFESNKVKLSDELSIRFDLLMNEYEQQQNKLTLYIKDNSKTLSFLQHKKNQELKISEL